ncbi:hypothetical protein FRB91_007333 [Serendipita sp. 411]|nr:hypothetical protein FRB91_007333 [Serendipita sp. 411]
MEWLEEQGWTASYGGVQTAYGYDAKKGLGLAGNDVIEPPSPTGSIDGELLTGARIGETTFSVAPNRHRRYFDI